MSNLAIRIDGIGKRYRLGMLEERPETLAGTAFNVLKAPLRSYRNLRKLSTFDDGDGDDVLWALRDVSFDVKHGEVVGLIGRNGAGKSTLLKVLARITEPTTGCIELFGRVASLLEVGTGFHPDLTGRENVYLNGTILGMTKAEIDQKFDEIVAFSEIEQFIDTPVKRYSSGMKVRLAFSVAAHLEPEILLVDEVLAVGDVAFQKKCLGKMDDVAGEGRTVIFVSHHMNMIQALCKRGIVMQKGKVVYDGEVDSAIKTYLREMENGGNNSPFVDNPNRKGNRAVQLTGARVLDGQGLTTESLVAGEPVTFEFDYENVAGASSAYIGFSIFDSIGVAVANLQFKLTDFEASLDERGVFACHVPRMPLIPGSYRIGIRVMADGDLADEIPNILSFGIESSVFYPNGRVPNKKFSTFMLDHEWQHRAGTLVHG